MEHLIGFALGIIGNLVAYDVAVHHKKWCNRILDAAAKRLPAEQQASRLEEWSAQLADSEGIYPCFRHALGCWIGAPAIAEAARTTATAARAHTSPKNAVGGKTPAIGKQVTAMWRDLSEFLSAPNPIMDRIEAFLKRDTRRLIAATVVSAIGTVVSTVWLILSLFHH